MKTNSWSEEKVYSRADNVDCRRVLDKISFNDRHEEDGSCSWIS